jgi:hypothetical protein
MYLLLIFFSISLAGIVIMISRELVLIKNGHISKTEHLHPFVPELLKIKQLTIKGIKKTSYVLIFISIKSYLLSSKFIKEKSKLIAQKIEKRFKKDIQNFSEEMIEKKEVSKYLKIISEYRQKIRQMKHKIKEEEGIE